MAKTDLYDYPFVYIKRRSAPDWRIEVVCRHPSHTHHSKDKESYKGHTYEEAVEAAIAAGWKPPTKSPSSHRYYWSCPICSIGMLLDKAV